MLALIAAVGFAYLVVASLNAGWTTRVARNRGYVSPAYQSPNITPNMPRAGIPTPR